MSNTTWNSFGNFDTTGLEAVLLKWTDIPLDPISKKKFKELVISPSLGVVPPWSGVVPPWSGVVPPWSGVVSPWSGVVSPWSGVV